MQGNMSESAMSECKRCCNKTNAAEDESYESGKVWPDLRVEEERRQRKAKREAKRCICIGPSRLLHIVDFEQLAPAYCCRTEVGDGAPRHRLMLCKPTDTWRRSGRFGCSHSFCQPSLKLDRVQILICLQTCPAISFFHFSSLAVVERHVSWCVTTLTL